MDENGIRYLCISLLALMVTILSSVPVWGISSRAQRKSSVSPLTVSFLVFLITAIGLLSAVPQGKGLDPSSPYAWACFLVPLVLGLICNIGLKKERISTTEGAGFAMQAVPALLMAVWIVFIPSVLFKSAPDPTVRHNPNIVVGRITALSKEVMLYENFNYTHNVSSVFLFRIDKMGGGMLFLSGAGRCLHQLKVGDRVRIQYNLLPESDPQKYIAGAAASVRCLEILKEGDIPEASLLVPRTNTVCGCI